MIRSGPRGSGQWKTASWEEALGFVAEKLKTVTAQHGPRAIALADRGGLFTDLTKSFLKALGSPNYFDHDDACASNVNLACKSLFGCGRGEMIYDFAKAKHIVLYGRNVFESLQVKEVNNILDAMERGAKLTYVDIRATVTASKADRFLMVRPGTDYALNLGLIHVILQEGLYDKPFVDQYVTGLPELERFVAPYTPEWAAEQTGLAARDIVAFAREAGSARPRTLFHGGWMTARYSDSFYACRSAYILNVLMGNIEAEGGLILAKSAKDAGVKPLHSLGAEIPAPAERIVDGLDMPNKPLGTGHVMSLYKAVDKGEPYPIRAFIAYRYDPLAALPDPDAQKKILDRLDLLVSIDVNYSDTAWYADVILPEATYLERSNIIAEQKGPAPAFAMRRQAVAPRFDSKPSWEIFCLLADKMGAGKYFPYRSIEEIWKYQLEGTGVAIEDFAAKGFVKLAPKPILMDRSKLKFKTPSGKIELVSAEMARASFESLKPFASPAKPPEGSFRLAFGRSAAHTHAQSQNNPCLHEVLAQNTLWINDQAARRLGIGDSEEVEVVAADGHVGRITAEGDAPHPPRGGVHAARVRERDSAQDALLPLRPQGYALRDRRPGKARPRRRVRGVSGVHGRGEKGRRASSVQPLSLTRRRVDELLSHSPGPQALHRLLRVRGALQNQEQPFGWPEALAHRARRPAADLRRPAHDVPLRALLPLRDALVRGGLPHRRDAKAREGRHRLRGAFALRGLQVLHGGLPLWRTAVGPGERQGRQVRLLQGPGRPGPPACLRLEVHGARAQVREGRGDLRAPAGEALRLLPSRIPGAQRGPALALGPPPLPQPCFLPERLPGGHRRLVVRRADRLRVDSRKQSGSSAKTTLCRGSAVRSAPPHARADAVATSSTRALPFARSRSLPAGSCSPTAPNTFHASGPRRRSR